MSKPCHFSFKIRIKRNTMATSQLLIDTENFDEMIVDVITDLKRKNKHADCESIHKEIVKIADFSSISTEDLSRYTHNCCYNSNYMGIITNYKYVLSTCNSLLFSIILGLHLSIIKLG